MNVVIQQTPAHTTFDGHTATYAVCRDLITCQRVAMVQVVQLADGATEYRTMDRRSLPHTFTFDDAIKYAASEETRRRASRPPTVKRQAPFEPPRPHPIARHIRPMHLPPLRGYQRPPESAPPMRRLLCKKLAERHATKAVA